jgi:3-methyladenine DNA glycosylase Mpg
MRVGFLTIVLERESWNGSEDRICHHFATMTAMHVLAFAAVACMCLHVTQAHQYACLSNVCHAPRKAQAQGSLSGNALLPDTHH